MLLRSKNKITVVLLLCSMVAVSCRKMVDAGDPVNTITDDKAFNTDANANAVMAGLYSQLMNNSGQMVFSNGAMTIYGGLSADELINFAGTTNEEDYRFYTNQLVETSAPVYTLFWMPAYQVIYGANAAIENLATSPSAGLTDSARKQFTGEAKFIRAFCYFYLTNLFGDVPLVLTTDFNQTASMARTPQEDVYTQILADLEAARDLLPDDYSASGGERVRVNRGVVTALLARIHLYLGDWQEAASMATEVINDGQYKLAGDLDDVFISNGTEAIWQLEQDNTVRPFGITWEGNNFIPTIRWSQLGPSDQAVFAVYFSLYSAYLVPAYELTQSMADAFEPGDQRKVHWTDSVPTPAGNPYNGVVYYYPVKYTQQIPLTGGTIYQYYTVLRLAEQYLIRAEARAELGTDLAGAAADLDSLRVRAGLAPTTAGTQSQLLDAVAQERRVELFAEWGHRWLDLKRTGKAQEVLGSIEAKQPWSNNALVYPIPYLERLNDPHLLQNTGY